jgi:aldehyde dehydrogenase (NAD+)
VDLAVSTAQAAFTNGWKDILPAKRGELLNKLATLIERDTDEFASIDALDVGTPFGASKHMQVPQATETLRYFAGWADKITGQLLNIPQGYAYTRREPLGVCAAVVPWNAPL